MRDILLILAEILLILFSVIIGSPRVMHVQLICALEILWQNTRNITADLAWNRLGILLFLALTFNKLFYAD